MDDQILVSVCCTAYNHEKYIRKCLDGFVMQQTNFKYEVIINDDASTDNTAAIIREYEEKYPNIIKPIYQTENQFSIDRNITFNIIYPRVKGKYIALCEGDDFWIDPHKLQKQVDALENNPNCHMCVSKVTWVAENGIDLVGQSPSFPLEEQVLHAEEFLKIILREYAFQTSGYFFRSQDIWNYTHPIPRFREISPVGDIPDLLYFGQLGDVYYIDDPMSCYRRGSIGSWNQREYNTKKKQKNHMGQLCEVYREYDKYTEFKYHQLCVGKIFSMNYLYIAETKDDFRQLIAFEGDLFNRQPVRRKTRIYLGAYCPSLLKIYYKITRQV